MPYKTRDDNRRIVLYQSCRVFGRGTYEQDTTQCTNERPTPSYDSRRVWLCLRANAKEVRDRFWKTIEAVSRDVGVQVPVDVEVQ